MNIISGFLLNIEIKNVGNIKIIIEVIIENIIPKIRLSFPPLIILSIFFAP